MVAMATAVSGTGPTYVFLVMEALIDAAVHLGFPRHIAHDLVIETLEGSTSSPASRACTRPSCGTWSHLLAGRRPRHSTSSRAVDCGRCSPRPCGPPSDGRSSSATSSRRVSTSATASRHRPRDVGDGDQRDGGAAGRPSPHRPRRRPRARPPVPVARRLEGRGPVGPTVRCVAGARRGGLAPPRCSAVGCRRPGLVAGRARRPSRRLAGVGHRLRRDGAADGPMAVGRRL